MRIDFAKWPVDKIGKRGERTVRWRLLELLNIYRLILAGSALSVAAAPHMAVALGIRSPRVLAATALFYLLFGLLAIPMLVRERPSLFLQSRLEPLLDLLAAAVLTQAVGVDLAGLALLLVLPVAVGSAAAANRSHAYFPAAAAALLLLTVVLVKNLGGTAFIAGYTAAALLGLGLFALAWLGHFLATRLLASEALAQRRGLDVARLDALNRRVIAELDIGLVVIDAAGRILRSNPAVHHLLGDEGLLRLAELIHEPQEDYAAERLINLSGGAQRRIRLRTLGNHRERLVFIEDANAAAEQAQALKLTALGRLSAGIAHQVRNPLAAISHANQLLGESAALGEPEQRLVGIIERQSRRLEQIIEDVLRLSRRAPADTRDLDLPEWLQNFRSRYGESHPERLARLKIHVPERIPPVRFDSGHLSLIVENLVDNAFGHGASPAGATIRASRSAAMVYLDVLDRGPGVAGREEAMFEPFTTTHAQGTGLGLYLARELAVANGAEIIAATRPGGGARFRLRMRTEP